MVNAHTDRVRVSRAAPVSRTRWRGLRVPFWFTVPALALYLFVSVVPAVRGAVYAFTDWDGLSSSFKIVGLENFVRVFSDPLARDALLNTLLLALLVTVFQNIIGLGLALALNTAVKSRNVLRTIFFAPVILTPLVAGYIWSYLLAPDGGVNSALQAVGLGALAQNWLGDPHFALLSVVVEMWWQFAGYSMVIFLAGLKAVPAEYTEAALMDGAGPIRRFISIIFPLINGAVVINLLLSLIGGLNQFDQVYAMTEGGPGDATETISTVIYKNGFQLGDYPFATALSVVMTLLVGFLAIVQYRLTLRQVR